MKRSYLTLLAKALKVAFRFLITSRQLAGQQKTTQGLHIMYILYTTIYKYNV